MTTKRITKCIHFIPLFSDKLHNLGTKTGFTVYSSESFVQIWLSKLKRSPYEMKSVHYEKKDVRRKKWKENTLEFCYSVISTQKYSLMQKRRLLFYCYNCEGFQSFNLLFVKHDYFRWTVGQNKEERSIFYEQFFHTFSLDWMGKLSWAQICIL